MGGAGRGNRHTAGTRHLCDETCWRKQGSKEESQVPKPGGEKKGDPSQSKGSPALSLISSKLRLPYPVPNLYCEHNNILLIPKSLNFLRYFPV